jgi:uncharacterized protein (TIGR04255 family)
MPQPRHLSNAPITEAIIDFRVKLSAEISIETLNSIHASIIQKYPKRRERKQWRGRIELKEALLPNPIPAFKGTDGYLFSTEDDKQTVQVRLDGFTFNRLKPYGTWEELRDEARRLWDLYARIATPELITRVAVRYINQLDIPLPIKDFSDYLVAPPTVPENLPQGVNSFLTRVVFHDPAIKVVGIIHQALESLSGKDVAPIILDIDVFRQATIGINKEDVWELLEKMHDFKNKIFFESVTEKTLRLFE